ncbi:MAG: AraC family transcriptional regulator [Treponema sp.]|nr:AraC family transcriptional regulator [Treponema sp.]
MKEQISDDFVPKIDYHVFRKCTPDWRLHPHFVNGYDLTYLVEGKARYTINGEPVDLGPGDIIYLTDGAEKEAVTFPQNLMHCFAVNFNPLNPSAKSRPPLFPVTSHIGLRQDIIDSFRELTISWSRQQDGYIMKTRALLMLILHRLSEILIYNTDSTTGDYRINKAAHTIAMQYSDKLTVKRLAGQVNLDEAYFGHLFKKETGMTVHQYITMIRVRNAENMLQSGNYKVNEVAEHCGFSDVIHFYKSFRALRGFPPSRCIPKSSNLDIEDK